MLLSGLGNAVVSAVLLGCFPTTCRRRYPLEPCIDKRVHGDAIFIRCVEHSDHVFAEDVRLNIDLGTWFQGIQVGLGLG